MNKNSRKQIKSEATKKQSTAVLQQPGFLNPKHWSLVLPLLAFFLYAQTITYDFALDDIAVITQNKIVQKGFGGIPELCKTFYWQGFWNENAGLYRPASMIMFAMEYEFGQGSATIHHLMNVLLYALSIFFLYRFLRMMLKGFSEWIPVLACLIFLAHPYHTEVVANIKSRDEILCFLFFTLSGIYLLKALENQSAKINILSAIFLFLSLMSKEGGVLFLPVLYLALYFFRKTPPASIFKTLIPHFAVTAIWLLIHYLVIQSAGPKIVYDWRHNSLADAPDFITQKATAIGILGRYLIKAFIPYEFSYDYSYQQIPNDGLKNAWFFVGLIFSLLLLIIAFKNLKNNSLLAFSILLFFITISLTSNIFMIIGATMADRFLFTPSLGFALAIAFLITKATRLKLNTVRPLIIVAPLLLFYSFKTVKRNPDWKSTEILYLADVKTTDKSSRTNYNAATIQMNKALRIQEDTVRRKELLDSSRNYLLRSVELDRRDPNNWVNLGVVNYKSKLYKESARATLHALNTKVTDTSLYQNLADAYFMAQLYDSSIYYHSFLVNNKKHFKETYNFLGSAWFNKKDYAKALQYFEEGVKVDSSYAGLRVNYANALAVNGRFNEAIVQFKKAYAQDPSQISAIYFVALTYQNMGVIDSTRKYLDIFNRLKSAK
jgi:protein O-mannosyl-transferase